MAHIAFIGLGQMGSPMAANLIKQGHQLTVYDVSPQAVEGLVSVGATAATSPAIAAKGAEFVITMLPNGELVQQVLFGDNGVTETLSAQALVIDMSTIHPLQSDALCQQMQQRGFSYMDAPVGRTSEQAVTGTLLILAGGSAEQVARANDILMCMGSELVNCQGPGMGIRVKLVNNYMSIALNALSAEAAVLCEALDLPFDVALQVMSGTPAGKGHFTTSWPNKVLKGDLSPAFMIDLAHKDLGIALDVANQLHVPMPLGAAATVFAGVAIGLVLGVPLSGLIADHVSLAAAFYFGAMACVLAFAGVMLFMPSMPSIQKVSFSSQLSVLRNGKLWLTISTVTLIFAAMFSSFSYVADYLMRITHLESNSISAMLILFGVCGFTGNFVFSNLLQKNVVMTTYAHPLLFTLLFLLVWCFGFSPLMMCILTVFWGALHSSGLVVSQTWLMREASEAPEFANSLYMSFSNLGITIGSLAGGWFIAHFGTHSVVLSSVIFTLLAYISISLKHRSDVKTLQIEQGLA